MANETLDEETRNLLEQIIEDGHHKGNDWESHELPKGPAHPEYRPPDGSEQDRQLPKGPAHPEYQELDRSQIEQLLGAITEDGREKLRTEEVSLSENLANLAPKDTPSTGAVEPNCGRFS